MKRGHGGKARALWGLTLALALVVPLLPTGVNAGPVGDTFTVRFLDDEGDANLTDTPNRCDAAEDVPGKQCTLRAAIEEANHTVGRNTIRFDIGGSSRIKTIRPQSSLPPITDQVVINGYSQPGARVNTQARGTNARLRIQLVGADAGGIALWIQTSSSLIRGLVINRFSDGILVQPGRSGNRIEGNFIGTDATGTRDRGNVFNGITLFGTDNVLGGDSRADRNIVSGNGQNGVSLAGSSLDVMGNLIGTDRTGTHDLGNVQFGVTALSANHTIGGMAPPSANVIAFNGEAGVSVLNPGSVGVHIRRNSIFSNGGPGIDLGGDGRTPNDAGDVDTGPNYLQNFPVIRSARTGRRTTIRGRLESSPNGFFGIQFFSTSPGGAAEGKTFLGEMTVGADGTGLATFRFRPGRDVPVGHRITATATDDGANTSELSNPRRVRSG
jgi:hypothetical protein